MCGSLINRVWRIHGSWVVLHDRVLYAVGEEEKSAGGIIPDTAQEKPSEGIGFPLTKVR